MALPFEADPFRSLYLPEPICSSRSTSLPVNSCQAEEPEPLVCTAPPTATRAAPPNAPPPSAASPPAVQQLVKNHPSTQQQASCTGERVALAAAAAKTAVSLAKVVLSAPTEVGLAYTVTGFVVDAATLGAATAEYMNCEAARKRSP
jgi:hypothetical protein